MVSDDGESPPLQALERVWWYVWPLFVGANVVAAFTFSFRTADLDTIRGWGHALLLNGANLYTHEYWCDYPPNAMVLLGALAWLPEAHASWVWGGVNLALAAMAPFLVAHAMRCPLQRRQLAMVATTFWCWSATHTLLQFTLLTMVFAVASWATASRRPTLSGVLLGLAFIKPQIAAPFVLWALFTRRWRALAVAVSTVLTMGLLYCAISRTGPVTVTLGYLDILREIYTGAATLPGASDLRPLVLALVPSSAVDLIANSVAGLLFAVVCLVGRRRLREASHELPAFVGLACVWALLTFRQLSYGLVLLLPLSAWLGSGAEGKLEPRARGWMFWLLQAVLIVDVPTYARRVQSLRSPLAELLSHFDRLYMLTIFVTLAVLLLRPVRRPHLTVVTSGPLRP